MTAATKDLLASSISPLITSLRQPIVKSKEDEVLFVPRLCQLFTLAVRQKKNKIESYKKQPKNPDSIPLVFPRQLCTYISSFMFAKRGVDRQ